MKKILYSGITAAAFFFSANALKAQDYAATQVKLNLADFITAYTTATVVHSNSDASVLDGVLPTGVTFSYSTAADYATDKNQTIAGHLKVSSSKNFEVSAKAMNGFFMDQANALSTIPASIVKVSVRPDGGAFGTYVGISTAFQTLLSGQTPGLNKVIDADYKISAVDASASILGKGSGDYKNTIVYRFSQP